MKDPARILVRATNWVGDAIMSLPALRAIRSRYPQAHIAVLARPWVADLYRGETAVDRVIPYTASAGFRDLGAKWREARELARDRFDCAILFPNSFESAGVARLAGIRQVIGYNRDGRGWLLTRALRAPKRGEIPPHERFYYLELLRRAGIIEVLPEVDAIRLERAAERAEAGRLAFCARGVSLPVIGVSPGAAYGSAKRWLPERFAESAAALADELGAAVGLFGSRAEHPVCEAIAGEIRRRKSRVTVCNLAGETALGDFINLAAACFVFLTNDSGAMHIASALGVPTVTVFGATNHLTTGPTGDRARVVRENVSCSPCQLRECPIDHRCMTGVPVERVVHAAQELLVLAGR